MATRLDEFFGSLSALPDDVVRSLELIRILDSRVQALLSDTAALVAKATTEDRFPPADRNQLQSLLSSKQKEAITCSKEKVCIVLQVMDSLRTCVTSLDQELAQMNLDMNPESEQMKTEDGAGASLEVNTEIVEPVGQAYCVCQRPSHGLMVACDNPNVRKHSVSVRMVPF